ncbi:arsenite methyltransferase [Magnetospira thiophila]
MVDSHQVHAAVRQSYAAVATKNATGCCGPASEDASGCCATPVQAEDFSARFGYSTVEMNLVPEGANLGLGCGNPQALAAMRPGEVVVDLGSGAGFDVFLAARQVGDQGRVIGVDMTHEMLAKARENAQKGGYPNVEFRLGEIEYLPIADNQADVVISNCVINLSPDKARVFKEAFRVLKPGGRVAVSDVVQTADFPPELVDDLGLLCGCVTGATPVAELEAHMNAAGFTNIRIDLKEESRAVIKDWAPGKGVENYVVSANIQATKPGGCCGGNC